MCRYGAWPSKDRCATVFNAYVILILWSGKSLWLIGRARTSDSCWMSNHLSLPIQPFLFLQGNLATVLVFGRLQSFCSGCAPLSIRNACLYLTSSITPFRMHRLGEDIWFVCQQVLYEELVIDWAHYGVRNLCIALLTIISALQPTMHQCSEQGLVEVFYSCYAPSLTHMDSYERIVHVDISRLTFETLGKMLSSAEALQAEHVSYHILLVSPRRNRTDQFHHNSFALHVQQTSWPTSHPYIGGSSQIFVRNWYTKASADFLDDVHDLFCNGGEWRVTPMTKDKPGSVNTHFKSPLAIRVSS